jgi:hypothetical protein
MYNVCVHEHMYSHACEHAYVCMRLGVNHTEYIGVFSETFGGKVLNISLIILL